MLPTFHLPALAWLPCAVMLLSSSIAVAQAVPRPDPATAATVVPPLVYESPLARYRTFSDQAVAPWRESNDAVGRIGGWRAYAREAAEPAAEADSTTSRGQHTAPAVPGGGSHGHMPMHKHMHMH